MAAVAVAAPLHWWSVAVHGRRREWVLKPLVLALLIVTAWFLGASGSATGWWLLVALGLSLVGELALVVVMAAVVGRRVVPAARAEAGQALAGAVAAYMTIIGAMVLTAWATGRLLVALGATAFMVSDAILALNRFVRPRRFGPLAVMVTYHVAQALIVIGVLAGGALAG